MKGKMSILMAALVIMLPCAACGQTAEGIVIAPKTEKITAPYSGTLLPTEIRTGDVISAGEMLFTMDENPVYAREGGTVTAVFAKPGDDAAGIVSRYGGLAIIEPEHPRFIAASTREAYNDPENKWLKAGETLYLKKGNDKGTGRVTVVEGSSYQVEILTGTFDVDDTVTCYRDSSFSNDSSVGKGKVLRYPDVLVTAAGRVSSVKVGAGDTVAAGDVLFTMLDGSAPVNAETLLTATVSGAVSALYTRGGEPVIRGQLLCEIADLNALELSCDLDEMDFSSVRVGDSLTYTLDAYGEQTFTGTVLALRPLGQKRTNASYFDLRVSLPKDIRILPGMNATITIN